MIFVAHTRQVLFHPAAGYQHHRVLLHSLPECRDLDLTKSTTRAPRSAELGFRVVVYVSGCIQFHDVAMFFRAAVPYWILSRRFFVDQLLDEPASTGFHSMPRSVCMPRHGCINASNSTVSSGGIVITADCFGIQFCHQA